MKTSLEFVQLSAAAAQSSPQIGGVVDRKCVALTPCDILSLTRREFRPMEQVSFQDNGTKVAAVNTKTYIFQRSMSRGPESDLIRTVNIPTMVSDCGDFTSCALLHSFPLTPSPRFLVPVCRR